MHDDEHLAQLKERSNVVNWPEPRDDPKEEPTEPWAKLRDRIDEPKR